jgi:hypothetical protein
MPEVRSIDFAIAIHIARGVCVRWSPLREQRAEIRAVHLSVDEQVCKALASIRNCVVVEVRRAGSDLDSITYAIAVTVVSEHRYRVKSAYCNNRSRS